MKDIPLNLMVQIFERNLTTVKRVCQLSIDEPRLEPRLRAMLLADGIVVSPEQVKALEAEREREQTVMDIQALELAFGPTVHGLKEMTATQIADRVAGWDVERANLAIKRAGSRLIVRKNGRKSLYSLKVSLAQAKKGMR